MLVKETQLRIYWRFQWSIYPPCHAETPFTLQERTLFRLTRIPPCTWKRQMFVCGLALAWSLIIGWQGAGRESNVNAFDVQRADGSVGRPNVLLIVADDLGYSDLGCYGGEIRTPNLDKLAEQGLRLTQFYNAGRCCPSRASILTGQYPHRVGLGHMTNDLGLPGYQGRLASDAVTIADVLSEKGYRTFLSGKWHLGTKDPTRHGFDGFYGTLVSAKTFWDPDHFMRLPEQRTAIEYETDKFYGTDALTDHALEFMRETTERPGEPQPWFLYLAFNAPHFPLQAPVEDIERYADRYHVGWDVIRRQRLKRMKNLGIVPQSTELSPRSRFWDWGESQAQQIPAWDDLPADRRGDLARRMAIYAAMIDRMDQNIGRIIEYLQARQELKRTLIIFISDNGGCAEWDEAGFDIRSSRNNHLHWGEELQKMGGPGTFHSVGAGWANASNTPWRLYKHFNHEGGIASPAIFVLPTESAKKPTPGRLDHEPAHIVDLFPTILDVAGVEYGIKDRSLQPLAGISLLERGDENQDVQQEDRPLYFEHQGNRAVRQGNWKLVSLKGGPWELYNLTVDRGEQHDLASHEPGRVESMARQWEVWAEKNKVEPMPRDYQVDYLPRTYER